MSDINQQWVYDNFSKATDTIFYIGAANGGTPNEIVRNVNGNVFMFECNPDWHDSCLEVSASSDRLHYINCAISGKDDVCEFWPSGTLRGKDWPWSGSICKPTGDNLTEKWTWKETIQVVSRSLESICNELGAYPDFIHMDTQGSETVILSAMPDHIRPAAIWCEITEFHNYETGETQESFDAMMSQKGYTLVHQDRFDALYVHHSAILTEYIGKKYE